MYIYIYTHTYIHTYILTISSQLMSIVYGCSTHRSTPYDIRLCVRRPSIGEMLEGLRDLSVPTQQTASCKCIPSCNHWCKAYL